VCHRCDTGFLSVRLPRCDHSQRGKSTGASPRCRRPSRGDGATAGRSGAFAARPDGNWPNGSLTCAGWWTSTWRYTGNCSRKRKYCETSQYERKPGRGKRHVLWKKRMLGEAADGLDRSIACAVSDFAGCPSDQVETSHLKPKMPKLNLPRFF